MADPERTCVVCRGAGPKKSLLRLAWDLRTERPVVDERQVAPGRGAYVHPACWDPSTRSAKKLGRALRRPVESGHLVQLSRRVAAASRSFG